MIRWKPRAGELPPFLCVRPQMQREVRPLNAVVKSVLEGSPAHGSIIEPGDVLRKVNGSVIGDILDYKYLSYDARLLLELTGADGRLKLVRLRKPEGADIGLEFGAFLMDSERSCTNRCIFCFIDQLPRGMRKTLYYKDDDVRLSFFQGNYVTLTNLSPQDIERIIQLRVSPINVSVHTLDPDLRAFMLGSKEGAAIAGTLKMLTSAGITLNCQIVCCPGINDGAELRRTMEGLYAMGPCINSVSVVPVGLTKHRERLAELRPFVRGLAAETVRLVDAIGARCLKKRGSRVFFCADELYMKAGMKLPPHGFYEDYPQLENGVGMMRLFITEFEGELGRSVTSRPGSDTPCGQGANTGGSGSLPGCAAGKGAGQGASGDGTGGGYRPASCGFSVVTGVAACKYLTNLLKMAIDKHDTISGAVYAIRNDFFGDSVTVSGLVTGGDIIDQLKGRELGSRLLIPQNMLRRGEDIFLDDVTVEDVSGKLGVPVRIVRQNGADLLHAFLGG